MGPGRRRPSKLGPGSSTARELETRNPWKLAETKSHFPSPRRGRDSWTLISVGPASQIHFQAAALIPSVDSPSTLPGTQLGPSRGKAKVAPGRRSRTPTGDPAGILGPRLRCTLSSNCSSSVGHHLLRSRSPRDAKSWGGSGTGMFPLVGVTRARTRSLLAQLGAQDVWLDTEVCAAARGSPEPR